MILKDIRKLPIEPAKLQKDKIPIADRIQALKRIPQVKADLEAIEKAKREYNFSESFNLEENFLKRYKLPDYCVRLNIHPSVIKIIRPDHIKSFLKPIPVKSLSVGLLGGGSEDLTTIPLSHDEICKRLDLFIPSDGKHLPISIDLSKTETEIIAELKGILKKARNPVKKSQAKKLRKHDVDIWKVFEMYKASKNFTKIARSMSKVKDNVHPSYNKKLDGWRKAAKRAYRKAEQIYEKVKRESKV